MSLKKLYTMSGQQKQSFPIHSAPAASAEVKTVIGDGAHPQHVGMMIVRVYLRIFGIWPNGAQVETRSYRAYNAFILTSLSLFVLSIMFDLYDASADFVTLGDDLVVLLGLGLVLLKIWLYRSRAEDMDAIISEFDHFHRKFAHDRLESHIIRDMQRKFFIYEMALILSNVVLVVIFFIAISIQPLVTNHPLPFRAKLPFGWHDPARSPGFYVVTYIFQCICTAYNLLAIILIDNIGCEMLNQTSLNLRILCIRMGQLRPHAGKGGMWWLDLKEIMQLHQQLIALIDRINRCFYSNYVAQMACSTFIICLTAFEALLAKDKPAVAIKFQMYMICAFEQLFVWCWFGNRVHYDSLEISNAAFEIEGWFDQSPQFQRNLMFFIQRAQKPLVFRAKPLYGFTFETFASILSTSYSYFTLLRTMSN